MNILLNNIAVLILLHRKKILFMNGILLMIALMYLKGLDFDSNWKIWYTKKQIEKYDLYVEEFSYDDSIVILFQDSNGILNSKAINTIQELTTQLEQLPYIGKVESLSNVTFVYNQENAMSTNDLMTLLQSKRLQDVKNIIQDNDYIMNYLIDENYTTTMIVAKLDDSVNTLSYDPSREITNQVNKLLDNISAKYGYQFDVYGGPIINTAFEELATYDVLYLIPLGIVGMLFVLYVLFRSIYAAFVAFVLVLLTTIYTFAIESTLGNSLNNFTINTPLYIIVIVLADFIHFYIGFLYAYKATQNIQKSIVQSFIQNIKPIFLTSLTTAIGFFSLMLSDVTPVKLLGQTIGISAMIAWLLIISLLPVLLIFKKNVYTGILHISIGKTILWLQKCEKILMYVGVPIVLLLISGILFLNVDSNLYNYFEKEHPVRKTMHKIEKNLTGSVNYAVLVDCQKDECAKDPIFLKTIYRFQKDIQKTFNSVKKTISIADLLIVVENSIGASYKLPNTFQETAQLLLMYESSINTDNNILNELVDFNMKKAKVNILVDMRGTQHDLKIFHWIKKWWKNSPYKVEINGSYPLFALMQTEVGKTLILSLLFTLMIIAFILWFIFRSIRNSLLLLLPNVVPVLIVLGIMGWLNIAIDLGVAVALAITVSIAIDDTLHIVTKYQQCVTKTSKTSICMKKTYDNAGSGIFFTTLIIVTTFASLALSHFLPNRDFSLVSMFALTIALVFDLIFLPIILRRIVWE